MISTLIFIAILAFVSYFAGSRYLRLYHNIMMGKPTVMSGSTSERIKNVVLIALGQQKMFQRPLAAVLHLFIYVAFMITQVELIEILLDGLLGTHRIFAESLGGFYTFVISFIEVLSVLSFVATLAFFSRRNLLKLPRFNMRELVGWPTKDANLILVFEVVLITFIFMMNGAEMQMQTDPNYGDVHHTALGFFAISGYLGPLLFGGIESYEALHVIATIGWWGHFIMVMVFLCYLPFSKHLHIMLAFFNTYFARLTPNGELANMPDIQKEVASMMNPDTAYASVPEGQELVIPKFGAADVFDLERNQILAAYTCTECGRCTSECPANLTGKLLSPRAIVMAVRDRAEEIGENIRNNKTEFINTEQKSEVSKLTAENYNDGRNLFSYITAEELRACTTCNACSEACPVMISPVDIIMEMRRNLILEQSNSPEAWNGMFNNIENNFAPWAFSPDDRDKWMTSN